jgi:hypothetical protein
VPDLPGRVLARAMQPLAGALLLALLSAQQNQGTGQKRRPGAPPVLLSRRRTRPGK